MKLQTHKGFTLKIRIEDKIIFYSAIESLEINTRDISVTITVSSGAQFSIKCKTVIDCISKLDAISEDILKGVEHNPKEPKPKPKGKPGPKPKKKIK